jgi:hypothetical protein
MLGGPNTPSNPGFGSPVQAMSSRTGFSDWLMDTRNDSAVRLFRRDDTRMSIGPNSGTPRK